VAITLLASGTVPYPSTGTSTSFVLPLTGKGVQTGDVIVCFITTNSTVNAELTLPANTTSLEAMNGIGVGVSCGVYWYQAPASVPSSISFGWGATARRGDLAWVHLRGSNLISNGYATTAWGSSSVETHPIPQVNVTAENVMLLTGMAVGSGSESPTVPSGWTRATDAQEREGSIAYRTQTSPGQSPSGQWTTNSGWYQTKRWTLAIAETGSVIEPLEATLETETYSGFTGDVADGAAIFRDATTPASSVVITTNKEVGGGLYVYNLQGDILSSRLDGAANSVDIRDLTGVSGWDNRVLVMTSDREDFLLRFYWLNRTTKALTPAGTSSAFGWEPYGTCLYVHSDGQVYAFVTQRGPDDTSARNMYQYPLTRSGESVTMGSAARTVSLASVVEGLAADDATGYLFASQEDVGLYRYSASPSGGSTRTAVDLVGSNLVADIEDVAIARDTTGRALLLVSSQGDSSYHVYDATTFEHLSRFTVELPGGSPVTSTDGLDWHLGNLGPDFPDGLVVVHNGGRTPVSNFAFVDAALVYEQPVAEHYEGSLSITASGTLGRTQTGMSASRSLGITGGGTVGRAQAGMTTGGALGITAGGTVARQQTAMTTGGGLSFTGGGTQTTSPTPHLVGELARAATGELNFVAVPNLQGALDIIGTGTLSMGASAFTGMLTVSGDGTLTLSGHIAVAGALSMGGEGTLSFTGTPAVSGGLNITGVGSLGAAGTPALSGVLSMGGAGVLSLTSPVAGDAAAKGYVGDVERDINVTLLFNGVEYPVTLTAYVDGEEYPLNFGIVPPPEGLAALWTFDGPNPEVDMIAGRSLEISSATFALLGGKQALTSSTTGQATAPNGFLNLNEFSVGFWVYTPQANTTPSVAFLAGTTRVAEVYSGWRTLGSTTYSLSRVMVETDTGSYNRLSQVSTGGGVIPAPYWRHVVGVYDGTALTLYVDGAQVNTGPKTGTVTTPDSFLIEPMTNAGFRKVSIWDKALTGAEVAAMYEEGP